MRRVGKFLSHLSIDALFRTALGPDLEVLHVTDGPWVPVEWKYGIIDPVRIDESRLGVLKREYDLFVLDDPQTFQWFEQAHFVSAKRLVFCNHGLYSEACDPRTFHFLQKHLQGMPIIYHSEGYRRAMQAWVKPGPEVVADLALLPAHFAYFSDERNGRILTVGNSVLERFVLYEGHEQARALFDRVCAAFPDHYDVFGYNDSVPVSFRRGFNPYVTALRYYSVGFYPSSCPVVDCSLIKTLAMGVPVVLSSPREELPREGNGKFYILEEDPDRVVHELARLRTDSRLAAEMGREAQAFAREAFSADAWAEKVRVFFDEL